jgi:hypothetical protein
LQFFRNSLKKFGLASWRTVCEDKAQRVIIYICVDDPKTIRLKLDRKTFYKQNMSIKKYSPILSSFMVDIKEIPVDEIGLDKMIGKDLAIMHRV